MDFHITTAIPYVNAEPHLGHALESVQADVLARHRRRRGHRVRSQSGTDDNAGKNVAAARAAGVPVREFVDANAARFAALRSTLALSTDEFVRTSGDPRHLAGVRALWEACSRDFYQRDYRGRYCQGCEQFLTTPCAEHSAPSQTVVERNWFFRLSRYASAIRSAIESGRVRITPAARRNEVLAFLRTEVSDISVSRPATRSDGWGIPVPGDPSQVVYVWWDALANYFTSDPAWWRAAHRTHVIGKGIVRFHAVHWLALLLSAGEPLPDVIFVHDYLTVDGAKISKSGGNAVSPFSLVDRYGVDAVRWWLLRAVAPLGDTDFTEARLVERANADLAGGIGNLVSRVRGLGTGAGQSLAVDLPARIDAALEDFDFRAATGALLDVVASANRLIAATRPWEGGAADVVGTLNATCEDLLGELSIFIPGGPRFPRLLP